MSSHHIVREKQEPALLILGLDQFSEEMLGQLLEWSPTVITTPLTAEQINAFGIKIDLIIADIFEQGLQSDIKLIMPAGVAPVTAALKHLIAGGYGAVNIVTDQFELQEFQAFAEAINIVIFSGGKKIYPVNSGFSKWKPASEVIRILSPSLSVQTVGLKACGVDCYQTSGDGFITLKFSEPFLFVAEDL